MNCRARLFALALACGLAGGLARPAAAQQITVSAAASLQNPLREIGAAYEATHPGATVRFNFAASGALLAQIAQGAPVDAFASADLETMDKAQAQGLIDAGARVNFATNQLVLVSPRAKPASLNALADMGRAGVQRIAIGTPSTVPAGRYARAAIEKAQLWAMLTPKFVFAENVRQALQYVSRAEVDAGFVYRSDALSAADQVRIDFVVPTDLAVLYPIAPVAASRQRQAAGEFIAYVTSAAGQAVLAHHGFGRP